MYLRHAKGNPRKAGKGPYGAALTDLDGRTATKPRWLHVVLIVLSVSMLSTIITTMVILHRMNRFCDIAHQVMDHKRFAVRLPDDTTSSPFRVVRPETTTEHSSLQGVSIEALPKGDYLSALMAIRCFITPDCFPRRTCQTASPQKIKRNAKFEEQSFCIEDLRANRDNCIVYSFGIYHPRVQWESKVAKFFGCEVHAFDPTMNHPRTLGQNVTFHQIGLEGEGTNMSATSSAQYKPIDPSRLMHLGDIMKKLGHEDRQLDVLMLDCEGCEWGALKQLACGGESVKVKQLVTEFHFQKNLGLYDESDVIVASEAIRCLWEERWNLVSIEGSGCGWDDWDYAPGMTQVLYNSGMLRYIALQRTSDKDPHVSDLVKAEMTSMQQLSEVTRSYEKQYGEKKEVWPIEANKGLENAKAIMNGAKQWLNQTSIERLRLDDHPLLDESEWVA